MKCQEPHKLISQVDLANMWIRNQMVGDVSEARLSGWLLIRQEFTDSFLQVHH